MIIAKFTKSFEMNLSFRRCAIFIFDNFPKGSETDFLSVSSYYFVFHINLKNIKIDAFSGSPYITVSFIDHVKNSASRQYITVLYTIYKQS